MNSLGPVMMDLAGTQLGPAEREQLQHPLVGGVILFTRNYENPQQISALCQQVREAREELLIAADTEGGRVQRFREGFFALPPMAAYGRRSDEDAKAGNIAAEAGAFLLAAELRAVGVDLAFAPVLDLDAGVSTIIGDRALHRDAARVAELGTAVLRGMSRAGMAATGKHFPGHGLVAPDSHAELPVDERELVDLRARDLKPYAALIRAGLPSVMMAHVRFPAVDERPASFSRRWIGEILRREYGFTGAVFSDDLSMGGAQSMGDIIARADAALRAGCDMLPVCNRPQDTASLLGRWRPQPDPASPARLARLRGRRAPGLSTLRDSADYRAACAILEAL